MLQIPSLDERGVLDESLQLTADETVKMLAAHARFKRHTGRTPEADEQRALLDIVRSAASDGDEHELVCAKRVQLTVEMLDTMMKYPLPPRWRANFHDLRASLLGMPVTSER